MAEKREQLRHFSSRLCSRKISVYQRERMSAFGSRRSTCGRRKVSIIVARASTCLNMTCPSWLAFSRSKCCANFFLMVMMKRQRQSPYPCGERLMSISLNFFPRAYCSSCGQDSFSRSSRYSQQTSCGALGSPLRGGLAQSSALSSRLVLRRRQVQSRYDFCMIRAMMDFISMGALSLMGILRTRELQRTICVSTSVFSSSFRYYSEIQRYFSCLDDSSPKGRSAYILIMGRLGQRWYPQW